MNIQQIRSLHILTGILITLIGLVVFWGRSTQAMLARLPDDSQPITGDALQVLLMLTQQEDTSINEEDISPAGAFESSTGPEIGSWGALCMMLIILFALCYFVNFAIQSFVKPFWYFFSSKVDTRTRR